MRTMHNKSLGRHGEEMARRYLLDKGYKILEMNFRNRIGEIDLIAQDGRCIIFVEVKTRRSTQQGMPIEAVHYFKRRKIVQVALCYLKYKFHSINILCRFDVICIQEGPHADLEITHIPNAFDLTYLS